MALKKRYMGIPLYLSLAVIGVCVIGIAVGVGLDWQISSAFSDPTALVLEYTAPLFYTWLFTAAGVLFYRSLAKDRKGLGIFLLVISTLYAAYALGVWLSKQYALIWPTDPSLSSGIGYLTSALVSVAEMLLLLLAFLKKDVDSSYSLRLAIMVFLVAILSETIGLFIKGFINRPRYRNIVAEGSTLSFMPFFHIGFWASSSGASQSCPSGHMVAISLLFILPLFHPMWKFSFKGVEYVSFGLAFAIIVMMAICRIYDGAHFLSDVSFGVLVTYLVLFLAGYFFFPPLDETEKENLA